MSWTASVSYGKKAALHRSVRLHGVLHTPVDIQVWQMFTACDKCAILHSHYDP